MGIARAATEAEAASLALGLLGQPAIAQLTDKTLRARAMRLFYANVRDDLQRAKWWSMCRAWVRPSREPTDSIGPLKFRFPMPDDCLLVRYLDDGAGNIFDDDSGAWALENGTIDTAGASTEATVLVTNIASPLVCYTKRVDNVRLWHSDFLTLFSEELAGRAATKLGRSATRAAELRGAAAAKLDTASAIDSKEKSRAQATPQETGWLAARFGRRSR